MTYHLPLARPNLHSKGFAINVTCVSLLIFYGLIGGMSTAQAQTNAYITDLCGNGIFVIDTATNTVVTLIPFPSDSGPLGIALTPDGRRAYVTSLFPDSVRGGLSVIDIATHTEIAHISSDDPNGVGIFTSAVAITPDGTRAYVTDGGGVSVIDTATITVIASLPVGGTSPFGVAITPDSKRAYVVNHGSSSVSVIDTATNTVITTIMLAPGSGPVGIAISPNGTRAYVANQDSGTISLIDTATNTFTRFCTSWPRAHRESHHT